MRTLANFPYLPLHFRKDGNLNNSSPAFSVPPTVSDLIVISHGWHQDPDDAEEMYEAVLGHLALEGVEALAGRTFGVVGVFWPSDQFRNDLSQEDYPIFATAALAKSGGTTLAPDDWLRTLAGDLGRNLDLDPIELGNLAVNAAIGHASDADRLVEQLRIAIGAADGDVELASDHSLLLDERLDGRDLVARVRQRSGTSFPPASPVQMDAKGAPALGVLNGLSASVAWVLNQAAYFALKKRAGLVGAALGHLLDDADIRDVQRIHLVGHSFGGRLVTAAASFMTVRQPYSLSLLQAAFSHNGFGVDINGAGLNGAFRHIIDDNRIRERIVVTHTWNDRAVGVLYAIASRASRDISKQLGYVTPSFGGERDQYGGMGANGAQCLMAGESSKLYFDGTSPLSVTSKVNNIQCDFIRHHSDVRTAEIGRVLAAAMR